MRRSDVDFWSRSIVAFVINELKTRLHLQDLLRLGDLGSREHAVLAAQLFACDLGVLLLRLDKLKQTFEIACGAVCQQLPRLRRYFARSELLEPHVAAGAYDSYEPGTGMLLGLLDSLT
jgi:hypothetical protein